MNPNPILCLALVLSSGLVGCSSVSERPAAMSNAPAVGTFIYQIHMIDAKNGWAWSDGIEGSDLLPHPLLLHTCDGGRTWRDRTPRAFPYTTAGSCFLDSQTAWVTTPLDRRTSVCGLLHTTDGGKSWSSLIKQGTASYGRLLGNPSWHFFDAKHGVAYTADGGAGSSYVCVFETDNGGKDWKPVNIIPPACHYSSEPQGPIVLSNFTPERMVYCPPANVVITHGDMDDEKPKDAVRLSVSTNLGRSWRDLKLPLPSEKYREGLVACDTPVFLDGKNGWLPMRIGKRKADGSFAYNDVTAFYLTHDGGATWAPRPGIIEGGGDPPEGYGPCDIVSVRDIFVRVGANLFVTHDGAKSWWMIKPNIDFDRTSSHGGVAQIDFVDARHGWAVVYDTFDHFRDAKYWLYKTSDGGSTWVELPLRISQ